MKKIAFGLMVALAFAHGARTVAVVELPPANDAIAMCGVPPMDI